MARKRKDYSSTYNKENYKMFPFRVKKSDLDLIEKLESVSNRNAYITELIQEDIHPSILTIKQIKDRIKPVVAKHNIQVVYLIGSYARGEAKRNSDIDLYCEKGDINTLFKLTGLRDELEEALGKNVDVFLIGSPFREPYKEQIGEDRIRLW